jgi:signal transduction histidine kinase
VRWLRRLSLSSRLALAMGAIAVTAVAVSMLLVTHGVESRLDSLGRQQLRGTAAEAASLAATIHDTAGGFTPEARHQLREIVASTGYALTLLDPAGGPPVVGADRAAAPVRTGGRVVAWLTISPRPEAVLATYDQALQHELSSVRKLSAAIAVALALLFALITAKSLSRPLRRLTEGAERLKRGELSTEIAGGGGVEIERLRSALHSLAETLHREEELRRIAAADIAHELRTPVTGILSRIEAAQDGMLDPTANLEGMHAETLRLARLIEDVGHLAEAEKPGLLIRKTLLDLTALAQARADVYASFFRANSIRFVGDFARALVHGDRGRLEQVIDNLLANALRYTDEGGTVTLRVRPAGTTAVLEVRDTGIGIPPDDLPHIFERFWRADKSRSRVTGGAGIGLAVVRELVQAHEGHIEVLSAVGAGTTFRVTLPQADAPSAAAEDLGLVADAA